MSCVYVGEPELSLEEFGHVWIEGMYTRIAEWANHYEEEQRFSDCFQARGYEAFFNFCGLFLILLLPFDCRGWTIAYDRLMDLCQNEAADSAKDADSESNPKEDHQAFRADFLAFVLCAFLFNSFVD